VGINSRLDEIHAAILRVKLKHLDAWTEARRRNAERYNAALRGVAGIVMPSVSPDARHVFHQYTVRARERDGLRAFLKDRGVASAVYYPIPLHLQRALRHLGHSEGDFPESERAALEALSIPVYAELEPEKLDYVVECIREFYWPRGGASHA
jgi:dTDP-4-amino-4,6-dideoxygalactose transaminase